MTEQHLKRLEVARMLLHVNGLLTDAEDAKVKRRMDKATDKELQRLPAVSVPLLTDEDVGWSPARLGELLRRMQQ